MSWTDFHRRREILDAALRHAQRDPGTPLALDMIPGATDLFGDERTLLLALQHKWTQLLGGYLRAELAEPEEAEITHPGDQVDAVTRAWQRARADHETLRAVLDAALEREPLLRPRHEGELQMLAITAGLAAADEPRAEVLKVGHAFDALLRAGEVRQARRRSPMGHLLRLLAPSA